MSLQDPLQGHARFEKVRNLGAGTFGSVVLARDRQQDGKEVAIKFLHRGPGITEYVERELMQHRLLSHPHIIKFYEVFLTPHHLGIVLEYANGGDMYEYVVSRRRLSENRARWVFQQLIIAIDYLHKMGVANRDIKLENTLVSGNPEKPLIKVCDLGYAKHVEMHSAPDSKVGTPAYLAPEVITCKTYDAMVSDMWSCGAMLYVMLVGQYPFERPSDQQLGAAQKQQAMIKRITKAEYEVPRDVPLSPDCRDLLSRLFVADPSRRATVADIVAHPWFAAYLPAGVIEMNRDLRPRESAQSAEEIAALVRAARAVGAEAAARGGGGEDDYNYDELVEQMVA